jgi:hypothetical protein
LRFGFRIPQTGTTGFTSWEGLAGEGEQTSTTAFGQSRLDYWPSDKLHLRGFWSRWTFLSEQAAAQNPIAEIARALFMFTLQRKADGQSQGT